MIAPARNTALALLFASAALALPLGHIDTFEDGTTMGWVVGMPLDFTPLNIPTGGPAGEGDNYLRLTAIGGNQPGGRLAVNDSSANWTGDYTGVPGITMWVNNLGDTELHLRLGLENFEQPGPPAHLAVSADAVIVQPGSGWIPVLFPLDPASLTASIGTVEGALQDVNTLRIFHNPDAAFPGPPSGIPSIVAQLGVDNIQAVPEPATLSLIAAGLGLLALRRRS